MAEQDRVLVDLVIAAALDDVWAALRDPEAVGRWFGWEYDGLSAEIQQIFVEQAQADDGERTLSWSDGDTFVLSAEDTGTRLTVLRRGHQGAEPFGGAYDPIDEGWITFAQQLRFALERHPGEARRTVSGLGIDLGPQDAPLLSRLGLRSLGDEPVGSGYEVERADGTRFSGEVFFQTDLQVGLTVVDERDALLVVARTPPSDAPPNGQAMFVLNAWSVPDEEYAELEQRWTSWWSPEG